MQVGERVSAGDTVAAMLAWRPAAVMVAGFEHTEGTRRMLQASGCRVVQLLDIDGDPLDHRSSPGQSSHFCHYR